MNEDRVARQHRLAKLHIIGAHEITDAAARFRELEEQQARDLRHCFYLHDPGHHRMTRKMSLEKRFVDRNRLHPDAFRSAFIKTNDAIHHQERVTMRQDLNDFVAVEATTTFWNNPRNRQGFATRPFFCNCPRELGICGVAGFYCDEVTANPATDQREVADDIENFMA